MEESSPVNLWFLEKHKPTERLIQEMQKTKCEAVINLFYNVYKCLKVLFVQVLCFCLKMSILCVTETHRPSFDCL